MLGFVKRNTMGFLHRTKKIIVQRVSAKPPGILLHGVEPIPKHFAFISPKNSHRQDYDPSLGYFGTRMTNFRICRLLLDLTSLSKGVSEILTIVPHWLPR